MSWSAEFKRCESRADFEKQVKEYSAALSMSSPPQSYEERQKAQIAAAAKQVLDLLDDMGVELPATEQTPATVPVPFYASMHGHAQPEAGPGDSIGIHVALLGPQ